MTKQTNTVCLLVFALLLCGSQALAQNKSKQTTDPSAEKARELFDQATQALKEGNAAVGRDLLRRSLALDARMPTRYNLGIALRRTGQTTEAIDTFEGLLRERSLTRRQRKGIQQQLDGARAELATLIVELAGADRAEIELDGRPVGEASGKAPLRLVIDPGAHVVTARAGGTAQQSIDVGPGETLKATLHVMSVAERDRADKEKRRRRRAGWISGGIAVAAAVVVTAVLVSQNQTVDASPPIEGDNGISVALRRGKR